VDYGISLVCGLTGAYLQNNYLLIISNKLLMII